jgi:hypothetical protein
MFLKIWDLGSQERIRAGIVAYAEECEDVLTTNDVGVYDEEDQ